MSVWRTVRRETGGLVRSIGYDLRRRLDAVWSRTDSAYPEYDAYARRPRRAMLIGGLATLASIGVVGTYLVLAGGLGSWLLGNTHAPGPAGPPDAGNVTTAAHAPAPRPSAARKPPPSPGTSEAATGEPKSATPTRAGATPSSSARPGRVNASNRPSGPVVPPPPTDTATPTPSPTPSPAPTPSDSPTPTQPDPSPSADEPPSVGTAAVELSPAQSTIVPSGI